MKYIYLLLTVFIISACSKDDIGPMGLKHGQEVEVIVDHRYRAIDDRPLLLPNRKPSDYSLRGFDKREPGYIYTVKAKVHIDSNAPPIQDGSYYWLDFMEVISKEKYEGNEPFEIDIIQRPIPGGAFIVVRKEEDQYWLGSKIQLTYQDEEIESQLEEIWQHQEEIRQAYMAEDSPNIDVKWLFIKATVTHDPENFGKAYLVSHIEFIE